MDKSEAQGGEQIRKFSQDQFDMLKRCSDAGDMTEWNEWRDDNPAEEIMLEGAHFYDANLQHANLRKADLQGASLWRANLQDANLGLANLQGANLMWAKLQDADLKLANLEGANLIRAHLQDTDARRAIVDGFTQLWNLEIEEKTDFRGVGFENARIDAGTRQLLEYNARRMNWRDWYGDKSVVWWRRWLRQPVRVFWLMSDYGRSTGRIVATFFVLALVFAAVYYLCGLVCEQPPVANLFVDESGADVSPWLVPVRAFYFSVVTMTTLGFGDMYANSQSLWGHLLLMAQVILGYVLLGALVTRLNILFTAGGPSASFVKRESNSTDTETED